MSTPQKGSYHDQADPEAGVGQMMDRARPAGESRDADWEQVHRLVPRDLEQSARASGAIRRRRQVRFASDLLRLVLAYALTAYPIRLPAAWTLLLGLGNL